MKSVWCFRSLMIFFVICAQFRDALCLRLSVIEHPIVEESEEIAFKKLQQMEDSMINSMDKMVNQLMESSFDMNQNISAKCMGSILKVLSGITGFKLWAFKLLDATGIPFGGTFSGNPSAIGSFDQCLRVKFPHKEGSKRAPLTGQYCMLKLRPPLPPRPKTILRNMNLFPHINSTLKTELMNEMKEKLFLAYLGPVRLGICVPSACSKADLSILAVPLGQKIGMNIAIETCEVQTPFKLDNLQLSITNIISNNGNVFTTKKCQDTSKDPTVRGKTSELPRRNEVHLNDMGQVIDVEALVGDFAFQPIMNGSINVDSFIFISALLVSYSVVKHYDSQRQFNPLLNLFRRVLRFWPSLLVLMGITIILPPMGHGPFYKDTFTDMAQMCRNNWWNNLLFINNFWPMYSTCQGHTWYLAVDIQCFISLIIYFFLLFKKETLGNVHLLLTMISSVVYIAVVTYIFDFPPAMTSQMIDQGYFLKYSSLIYTSSFTHMGVYCIGLFLGTYFARNNKIKLSNWTTVIGWVVATLSALALLYGSWPWNNFVPYTIVEAIIYSSTVKTVWALCLGWVVIACFAGRGGVVNSILSWPVFQPFVRISYLLYLVHLNVILYHTFSSLGLIDITHNVFVFNFFGTMVVSHIVSVFIRLLFESPVLQLQNIFFMWLTRKKPTKLEKSSLDDVDKKPIEVVLVKIEKEDLALSKSE